MLTSKKETNEKLSGVVTMLPLLLVGRLVFRVAELTPILDTCDAKLSPVKPWQHSTITNN